MAGKTVLVLGGGVGGIVTANSLRRRLGPEHRVVLVDRRGEYLFAPSLLWVMVGQRRPDQITKDLRRMVGPGVEVLQAEAQAIMITNKTYKIQTAQNKSAIQI
ncbi:MAG: FAD-dependent oxidoreductase [Anaerolineae bacterium]|nr:FAD-dependent oxidoreductase [Anaerolineae bacterium]